ncbi:dehydrogenase [Mycolicibacterium canariasense]|uniref:Dehydrogenase n=1 Tax=Mycolicibacterium canariasense TaxID=228230 RepID=A0A124E1J9_MYCCR|nr:hypothetical protein AWB94_32595 [Mycolicibacterium canariasense]GAS93870.1 dehydrogenase [Mycolicibacterium canariasense]
MPIRFWSNKLAADAIEIEILVNSAGCYVRGPVTDSDPAQPRAVVDLNAAALTELTRALLSTAGCTR